MAGPPPKPSHLKLVTGTARKSRTNKAEPKPPAGVGDPPRHLSPRAVETWHTLRPMLESMGILAVVDGAGLEGLCNAYADGIEARTSLANPVEVVRADGDGLEVVARGGELTYLTYGKAGPMLRSRPELALIADADRRFLAYLVQFGLTPAARSKVSTTKPTEANPLESYFG